MKERIIRLFGKLLGLLGFAVVGTSCDGLMPVEYGTPYTSFEVTGKLIDKETKEPVSGIVIVYGEEHSDWDAAEMRQGVFILRGLMFLIMRNSG